MPFADLLRQSYQTSLQSGLIQNQVRVIFRPDGAKNVVTKPQPLTPSCAVTVNHLGGTYAGTYAGLPFDFVVRSWPSGGKRAAEHEANNEANGPTPSGARERTGTGPDSSNRKGADDG